MGGGANAAIKLKVKVNVWKQPAFSNGYYNNESRTNNAELLGCDSTVNWQVRKMSH